MLYALSRYIGRREIRASFVLEDLSHEFESDIVGKDCWVLSISEVYGEYISVLLTFHDALDHNLCLIFVEEVFSHGAKDTGEERTSEGPCRVFNNHDRKLEELVHKQLHYNIIMSNRALPKINV